MDRAIEMLGRTVNGVKPQRLRARVDDIVAGTLGNDDTVIGLHIVAFAIDPDFTASLFDPEKLVAVVVDFLADLVAGLERHQHQL